ncbi:MAG: fibronectin type III domain-containing protein [Methylococcales bacterium]|jgi:hypothetical protein|nr:fibronectin type III domain-containing protein [Methylococcales bacterium]
MKIAKVLLGFIKYSIAEKLPFYRNIVAKFISNPVFASSDMTPAALTAALDSFEASIIAARDGGHTPIAIMHDNEHIVDKLFRNAAHYVDKIADGDETIILSSGFQVSNQPKIHQKPPLAAFDGDHSGEVNLYAKAIDKAGSYKWEYVEGPVPADESAWIPITTTTSAHHTVSGLKVGVIHQFRVAAITPNGISDFCAPVSKLVV